MFELIGKKKKKYAQRSCLNIPMLMSQNNDHRSRYVIFSYHTIVINFLFISINMCSGCPKETSHGDSSFEYPQYIFWLRNKKNNFQLCPLIWKYDG